jgi:hypothetical protein
MLFPPSSPVSSVPLGQTIGIPDASLNEKLIPANDNFKPTALSMENFEAESILAPRIYSRPSISPLVIIAAFSFIALAVFIVRWAI